MQEQKFIFPLQKQGTILQKLLSQHLFASLLMALGSTVVLALLEVGLLLLFNPSHAFLLPFSLLFCLLLLLLEFALLFVGAFLVIKPLAVIVYLRTLHRAQESYNRLYIPLTLITNTRRVASGDAIQDEHVSVLNLVEQRAIHQLIVGVPGAGKTMALHIYQYETSRSPFSSLSAPNKIPIYISMKGYSLFLKKQQSLQRSENSTNEDLSRTLLLSYLLQGDLPDIRYLKGYMGSLFRQGRLLLLCDGLDEVEGAQFLPVSAELATMMQHTQNRVVITCREIDYRKQPELVRLFEDGQVACAVIHPLQRNQVAECVEYYVEKQDKQWRHTAGQVMTVIEQTRLHYLCTNPMLLFTLMGIIDRIGVERGKQIDTRGLLLREYVRRVLSDERKQAQWNQSAPTEQEVIHYLGELACAAHRVGTLPTIQLPIHPAGLDGLEAEQGTRHISSFAELADGVRAWLVTHPAQTASVDVEARTITHNDSSQLLQLALATDLITIDANNILSFHHELLAAYFVAEYLSRSSLQDLSIREELLQNSVHWSQPIALWAGLQDNALALAESFSGSDAQESSYALEKLALSLICLGVLWMPPMIDSRRPVILPSVIEDAFSAALEKEDAQQKLGRIFTLSADEGGQEIYYSLLSLLMVERSEEFLGLLNREIVLDLLFAQLQDAIDNPIYEAQVKRIVRVLGRFDGSVIDRAAQLSQSLPGRSPRLRAAVINTLGGTNNERAVQPLIERLRDSEAFIVERATNALIRLGPNLSLPSVLQEMEKRTTELSDQLMHQAVLLILERFMNEQDIHRRLSLEQYQSTIECILSVLTSDYRREPELQHRAQEVLLQQGRRQSEAAAQNGTEQRWDVLIQALLVRLSSPDEIGVANVIQVLQEIGPAGVPHLLDLLSSPTDIIRAYAVEILDTIRDIQALPSLLSLLSDKSQKVQLRAAHALRNLAPESIPGLIHAVLHDPDDTIADRAAQILIDIGQDVAILLAEALSPVVAGRTRFLVQALELVHDPRSIEALVDLLRAPQLEPLLVIAIIRALGQFADERVVAALLEVLATTNPQFYEEAVTALSQLGDVALPGLIAALDTDHESMVVQRVRRAILGMSPFPGERLMQELEHSTESQVRQILTIFRMQGREAAFVLAAALHHPDERLRTAAQQTLEGMPGVVVVPALLAVLSQPALRDIASTLLLKYPDAAIAPLVTALSDQERSSLARLLLPQFGPRILKPLIAGLDDPRSMPREAAQRVLIDLVRQNRGQEAQQVLREVVRLFGDPLPPRARETLMSLLTGEFAHIGLPVLLEGLEDVHLIEAVAEALTRMVSQPTLQEPVLSALIEALRSEDRRSGSEIALVRIGAPAVPRVGELIIARDARVARSAMHILSEIGVPALSFIWTAYSDRNNLPRREAARAVFRSMPPEVIKDELVSLLVGENRDDIAMAVALLLERIDDETRMEYRDQVMVPELIDYIETHNVQETNLRISALLLLLGEQATTDHLIQALDDNPQHRKELTYMLLLLGTKTQTLLQDIYADPQTNPELRNEVAGVLSMQAAPGTMVDLVYKLSDYGLSSISARALFSPQLSLALRVLGGLLVSGQWHPQKLMEMRDARAGDDPSYELFNVLLGWRYTPEIEKLRREMGAQHDVFKKELLALTMKLAEEQQHASSLETDLEKVRQDHGMRGDELQKTLRERDTMRASIEQLKNEKNKQQIALEETNRRYHALLAQYQGLQRQLQGLSQLPQGQSQASKPQNTIR